MITHEKTDSSKLPSLLEPPKCMETQTSCIEVYVKTDDGFQEVSTGKKITSESDGSTDFCSQTELQVPSAPPLMTSQTQTNNVIEGQESSNGGDRDVTTPLLEPEKKLESGAGKSSPKNVVVSSL